MKTLEEYHQRVSCNEHESFNFLYLSGYYSIHVDPDGVGP